jgi:tight adherence protein B
VIALASGLLVLAGVFAERSVAAARGAALGRQLAARSLPRRSALPFARPTAWALAALAVLLIAGPAWVATAAGAALVVGAIRRRRARLGAARRREEQLVDAVAAVSAGLRAGLSIPQALAYARDEAGPPLSADLSRLVGRIELGIPVGAALGDWAEHLASEDVRLIVGVLDLHRRSGGDLPAVLDGVVATLRERRSATREVRALTAQARLSGAILGALPIGFFGFLLMTSRSEMLGAIATPLGRTAVAVGLGLELAAFFWIRRLLEVK